MDDFRRNMHIAYKQKIVEIISQFLSDIDGETTAFEPTPWEYISKWVDSHCLPMGDFDKEKAIKEIEEWSK